MADLAAAIIDPSYKNMKKSFPKEKHQYWEWKPLSPLHLEYAAKDGYVSYELYQSGRATSSSPTTSEGTAPPP
jgi:hypothetical protein